MIAQNCMAQPGVKDARIHLSRAYLRTNSKEWVRFEVPRNLRQEIIAFDRGGRFAIGDYVLYKVRPTHATGKKQSSGGNTGRGKKHKRHRKHLFVTDVRPEAGA